MRVQAILDRKPEAPVATIGADATAAEAASVMAARRIGAIVVSDGGGVVDGMISERDIVRELAGRGAACLELPVSEMMTSEIVSAAPEDTADAVLERMTTGRFRHMPVIVAGRMVGLVSIGDVVKARLDELAFEKSALEGMIAGH